MEHLLKEDAEYFGYTLSGKKTFEIRKNDRNYKVGDKLILVEFNSKRQEFIQPITTATVEVLHVTDYMQQDGYVVMSTRLVSSS